MASSKLRAAASSGSGDLPEEALYEILLRVPAKDLCRLRAVCRAWRALTSYAVFTAAHKSRHTAPLLALAYHHNDVNGVKIVDLSGNVIRRIPRSDGEIVLVDQSGNVDGRISSSENRISVLPTHLDLICFTREFNSLGLWVLNPATGATLTLPACHSEELARELEGGYFQVELHAFGRVSSTEEYKVLRISRRVEQPGRHLCEVITLDGTNHGKWRGKKAPPSPLGTSREGRCVVVDGVVYFLIEFLSCSFPLGAMRVEPGSIASFNLETEEWMGTLRGPAPVLKFIRDSEEYGYIDLHLQLSLAELNGCLVTVHNVHFLSMGLWFLTDFEKGTWVKKYSIPVQVLGIFVYPFLVLDDGRILFRLGRGSLKAYDPRTSTFVDALEARNSGPIAIYTGNLLSL